MWQLSPLKNKSFRQNGNVAVANALKYFITKLNETSTDLSEEDLHQSNKDDFLNHLLRLLTLFINSAKNAQPLLSSLKIPKNKCF